MNANEALIRKFYTAFGQRDFLTMQSCYHNDATFSDPAFPGLSSKEVKAMWQMLLTASKDLHVQFSNVNANELAGSCHWDAYYTFSRTGRKVHNSIDATFEFRDGLIYRHKDHFDFWRWSRQALGTSGMLLGWSAFLRNKVQSTARSGLGRFIQSQKS
jgi:hypothetical protein